MNWNVPDWTDGDAYPTPGDLVAFEWGWQFLRRSPAYRKYWADEILPSVEADNFFGSLNYNELARFGLIMPAPPTAATCQQVWFLGQAIRVREHGRGLPSPPPDPAARPGPGRLVSYVLDLELDARAQLRRVRQDFIGLQKHRGVRRARLSDNYLVYLRVLDAMDAGVPDADVADALFSTRSNIHPDYYRSRAYRDGKAAAIKLRDGGYANLLAMATEK